MRVDDPSALPLSNDATAATERQGLRHRFLRRHGRGDRPDQRRPRLDRMVASNPSGTTLRVLDDGAGNTVNVNAVSATATATVPDRRQQRAAVLHRRHQLLYRRDHGAAARRASALPAASRSTPRSLADPSKLVVYQARHRRRRPHAAGFHLRSADRSAPDLFAADRHRHRRRAVHRLDQQLSAPGDQPAGRGGDAADNLKQGQDVVRRLLQQRFNDSCRRQHRPGDGQSARRCRMPTRANARVLSAVKDMIDDADEVCEDGMTCQRSAASAAIVDPVAGRHAHAARRSAAPARHRQEVRHLCRPRRSTAASRSACARIFPPSRGYDDTIDPVLSVGST